MLNRIHILLVLIATGLPLNAVYASRANLSMSTSIYRASTGSATDSLSFEQLSTQCAPEVHPVTLAALVHTESKYNPYAIGVVGGRLSRQPKTLPEALEAVSQLQRAGYNFSMGLSQVNRYNLARFGESYQTIFEPCRNLRVGSAILKECYQRAQRRTPQEQQALRAALSCYYSGNFQRGFKDGYVQKVVASSLSQGNNIVVPRLNAASNLVNPEINLIDKKIPKESLSSSPSMRVDSPLFSAKINNENRMVSETSSTDWVINDDNRPSISKAPSKFIQTTPPSDLQKIPSDRIPGFPNQLSSPASSSFVIFNQ